MSSSEEEYEDVKAFFSEMEWSGLVKWERKRYRNMKRNHLAMLAVGLKATAPAFMCRGQNKMADPPTLPGLSDSEEEEEEWTPRLERPPPSPRSFHRPARRPAEAQGAAPPPSTPARPAAQPPSSEVAGPSGSRGLLQPHMESSTTQGGRAESPAAPQDKPSTSETEYSYILCLSGVTSSQTEVFSCSECPVSYTSQIYLYKHIKRNHDNLYVSLLRSGEIRQETLSSSSSSRSLPITTSNTPLTPSPAWRQRDTDKPRPYHCDQCGKNFTRESSLRRHQRVHTGEKSFHCDQCGKNFNLEAYLRTHQRVHTGEKPYHCDQCGKNFSHESDLRRHQHGHTGEKPYHCDQCGKNFTRESSLRRHQRGHHGRPVSSVVGSSRVVPL